MVAHRMPGEGGAEARIRSLKRGLVDADSAADRPAAPAAEIEASVEEFNRLVALASDHHIAVIAEVRVQAQSDQPDRPVLAVQVIAPL